MLSGSVFGSPVALARSHPGLTVDVVGRPAPAQGAVPQGVVYHGKAARLVAADARGRSFGGQRWLQRGERGAVHAQADGCDPVPRRRAMGKRRKHPPAGMGMVATESGLEDAIDSAFSRRRISRRLRSAPRRGQRRRARRRTDPRYRIGKTAMTAAWHFSRYISVALLAAAGDWLVFILLASVVGLAPLASLMTARVAGGLMSFRHPLLDVGRQSAHRAHPAGTAFPAALCVQLRTIGCVVLAVDGRFAAADLSEQSRDRSDLLRDQLPGDEVLRVSFPGWAGEIFRARRHRAANAVRGTAADRTAFWNGQSGWGASRYSGARPRSGRRSGGARFIVACVSAWTLPRDCGPRPASRRHTRCGIGLRLRLARRKAVGAGPPPTKATIFPTRRSPAPNNVPPPRRDATIMRFHRRRACPAAAARRRADRLARSHPGQRLTLAELEHLFDIGRQDNRACGHSERNTSMTQSIHRA